MPRLFAVLLASVLVASACTGGEADGTAASGQDTTTSRPGDSGQGGPAPGIAPTDEPPFSSLSAQSPLLAPGDPVNLTGSAQLSGQLVLSGPDGTEVTAPFDEGKGSVDLPANAAEGSWQAVVTSDSGSIAVGALQVVSAPGLLLVADRSHVAPAGDVTVTLYAIGMPADTQVMLGWGDLDWNAYFEDEEEEGAEPLGVLIPDQHGLLQLGATPVALDEVVGVPLAMGGGLEIAGLQAIAFSPASEELFMSEPLALEGCAEPVPIQGTIGGPGAVHLLSFGDGLRTAAVFTDDGRFVVEAPHGPTAVFAARDDGQTLDPVSIDVPCNGMVEMDLVSGELEAEEPEPAGVALEDDFVPGESGTLTLSGDHSATFDVEPVCQYDGAAIEIIFGTYDLDLPAVQTTVSGGTESGTHPGTVEITDWSDVTTSTGTVEVGIEYATDTGLAEATMTLTGGYAGEAGGGTIEGTFSCTVLGLTPPTEDAATESEVEEVAEELLIELPPTVFDTTGFDPAITAPPCRILVVDDLDDQVKGIRTATALRAALSRATVVTLAELHVLFGSGGSGGMLGPGRSSIVALDVDGETPVVLVENESEADALASQVACIDVESVDVGLGETAELKIRATDLAGKKITGASVTVSDSEYGTVEPSDGVLQSGEFQVEFTGGGAPGEGAFTFEVGGDGYPSGFAFANVASGLAYTMEGQYRVELNPDDDADGPPIPPGPLSITLVAGSCTGRSGQWTGFLVLEAGPLLTMTAITGLAAVEYIVLFGGPEGEPALRSPIPSIGVTEWLGSFMANSASILLPVVVVSHVNHLVDDAGTDHPYQPIVLPIRFRLDPGGGSLAIEAYSTGFFEESNFAVRPSMTRPDQVSLRIEGEHLTWRPAWDAPRTVTGSHLLKATISQVPACLTPDDLADRVEEMVPNPLILEETEEGTEETVP